MAGTLASRVPAATIPPSKPRRLFYPRATISSSLPLSAPTSLSSASHFAPNPLLPLKTLRSHSPFRPSTASAVKSLFTGIVEEVGRVEQLGPAPDSGFSLRVAARTVLDGVRLGDSIAVNGACLTVSDVDAAGGAHFTVGLAPETLRRTSLGELSPGSPVNLERALTPTSRLGGHFVQGHVDGTGQIVAFEPEGDSLWVKVRAAPELLRLIVPKGFIAVDGTSLTVVGVYEEEQCFDFMLVKYTQEKVVLPMKKVGDRVNLEVDILGKYVEKFLGSRFEAVNAVGSQ